MLTLIFSVFGLFAAKAAPSVVLLIARFVGVALRYGLTGFKVAFEGNDIDRSNQSRILMVEIFAHIPRTYNL